MFEAALLIAASRELGIGVAAVPIASRYQGEFRLSHFSPVRDVSRITLYTIGRIFHYGHAIRSYRLARARPPLLVDAGKALPTSGSTSLAH